MVYGNKYLLPSALHISAVYHTKVVDGFSANTKRIDYYCRQRNENIMK